MRYRSTITAAAALATAIFAAPAHAETLIDPAYGAGHFGGKVCQEWGPGGVFGEQAKTSEAMEAGRRGCMVRAWGAQEAGMIANETAIQADILNRWQAWLANQRAQGNQITGPIAEAMANGTYPRAGSPGYTPRDIVARYRMSTLWWLY